MYRDLAPSKKGQPTYFPIVARICVQARMDEGAQSARVLGAVVPASPVITSRLRPQIVWELFHELRLTPRAGGSLTALNQTVNCATRGARTRAEVQRVRGQCGNCLTSGQCRNAGRADHPVDRENDQSSCFYPSTSGGRRTASRATSASGPTGPDSGSGSVMTSVGQGGRKSSVCVTEPMPGPVPAPRP